MNAIIVTSPLTEGAHVREAQRLLRSNVFEVDFLDEAVDGIFDTATGRACRRAKYALGYHTRNIDPGFGGALEGYLSGDRKLTERMRERRQERIRAGKDTVRDLALKLAKAELGVEERPAGSNNVKFSRWYMGVKDPAWTSERPGPAWCLIFCSWAYSEATWRAGALAASYFEKIFKAGSRYAFCPTVVALAAGGRDGFDQVGSPEPGDLVFYQFDDDSNADHVGIFEKWLVKGQSFTAIEGNTSSSSDANGGRVERRTRSIGSVYRPSTGGRAFVRVG